MYKVALATIAANLIASVAAFGAATGVAAARAKLAPLFISSGAVLILLLLTGKTER
jgi:hypothetical protein